MGKATRLIKKYPNRRLYDTETSTYITLADVKQLVLEQEDFQVLDAKSQEDLTRSILLQIILEEEAGGVPMFTSPMLSHMIRFYGHAMQGMMGTYLEKNLEAFNEIHHQDPGPARQPDAAVWRARQKQRSRVVVAVHEFPDAGDPGR